MNWRLACEVNSRCYFDSFVLKKWNQTPLSLTSNRLAHNTSCTAFHSEQPIPHQQMFWAFSTAPDSPSQLNKCDKILSPLQSRVTNRLSPLHSYTCLWLTHCLAESQHCFHSEPCHYMQNITPSAIAAKWWTGQRTLYVVNVQYN